MPVCFRRLYFLLDTLENNRSYAQDLSLAMDCEFRPYSLPVNGQLTWNIIRYRDAPVLVISKFGSKKLIASVFGIDFAVS